MLNLIFGILVWAVLGALPGYYVFLAKKRLPQYGLAVGAVLGVVMGELAVRLGVIGNAGAALLTLLAIWVGILLLLPHGEYDRRVTAQGRIAHIAYALTIPTILIVLGIVVFPLVWNLIFSVRDVRAADLGGIDIFDLSNLTMENFVEQVAFRVDPVSCEQDAAGSCVVDEDGSVVYEGARDVYDDYRGYREVNDFDLFGSHYAVGVQDRDFYPMIWRTIFYTLASTILAILFGLVAALLVLDVFPGRSIFRGFVLFPYIAPVISVAFIWQVLLRQNGLINAALGTSTSFLSTRDQFLGIDIPLIVVILFQTWRYFPFAFLFLLARLQAVPTDFYEAAKVDGAAPSQRLLYITLPQLRAVMGTLFLLRFIWTFNKFDDVFLLTGPITQTKVIPVQIFEALFTEGNIGKASATAVIMAAMLAVILVIYFRFFLVEEEA